jgi:hypothetical protein
MRSREDIEDICAEDGTELGHEFLQVGRHMLVSGNKM